LYEQGFTISGARNKLDSRGGEALPGEGLNVADSAHARSIQSRLDNTLLRTELMAILAVLKAGV